MSTLPTICNNTSRVKCQKNSVFKKFCYGTHGKNVEYLDQGSEFFVPANEDPLEDVDNAKPFNASSSWFCNYMKKYNFGSIKMRGKLLLL